MSARSENLKKQLRAAAKRRARRSEPTVIGFVPLKVNKGLEQRMIREHVDVLQNVEFALVTAAREADAIDDHVVEQILRYAIRQETSTDPLVQWASDFLATIRQDRPEVAHEIWRDVLRVVYTSLKRHSSCERGETSYLDFVSKYIV